MPRSIDPVLSRPAGVTQDARELRPTDRAWAMNLASQHLIAARDYGELAQAAEPLGQTGAAATARFWQGVSLHLAGRLREALGALAHIPTSTRPHAIDDGTRHMAITRYILVAIDMPLAFETIEAAITDVEQAEARSGLRRQARTLLLRARLAEWRGHYESAVRYGLEGNQRAQRESVCFATGTYRRHVVRGMLRTGALDEAEAALDDWQRVHDSYASCRRVAIGAFRSTLARLRGDVPAAITFAAQATTEARTSDDVTGMLLSEEALLRAHLCSTDPTAGRDAIRRILSLRTAESWILRYEALLCLGDYHLARVRRALGLPPLDVETGQVLIPAEGDTRTAACGDTPRAGDVGGDTPAVTRAERRARRAYAAAARIGATVDRLLACRLREATVAARLARLDAARCQDAASVRTLVMPGLPVRGRP